MISNRFAIEKFFGVEVKDYYETEVQRNMIKLHDDLRLYAKAENEQIQDLLDVLDNHLVILGEKMNYVPSVRQP